MACREVLCVVFSGYTASSVALVGATDSDADYNERADDGSADCHGKDSDILLRHILCPCYTWTHFRVRM